MRSLSATATAAALALAIAGPVAAATTGTAHSLTSSITIKAGANGVVYLAGTDAKGASVSVGLPFTTLSTCAYRGGTGAPATACAAGLAAGTYAYAVSIDTSGRVSAKLSGTVGSAQYWFGANWTAVPMGRSASASAWGTGYTTSWTVTK